MDKCPKCGNKLSPVDVLCPRCGALVEVIRVAEPIVPAENTGTDCSGFKRDISSDTSSRSMSRLARKAELRSRGLEIETAPLTPIQPEETFSEEKKFLEIEEVDEQTRIALAQTAFFAEPELEPSEVSAGDTAIAQTSEDVAIRAETDAIFSDEALLNDTPRRYRQREVAFEEEPQLLRKQRPIALIILAWVAVAAALFAGFYFLDSHVANAYGGYDDFVRQLTNGKVELDTGSSYLNSADVTVSEAQTSEGAPAHRFDVAVGNGENVKVIPLGESFAMEDGHVSFIVADEALAKNLGVVTYDPTFVTSGVSLEIETPTQTFSYPITTLTLSLTDAEYTRVQPMQSHLASAEDSLTIVIGVAPGATVYINNTNYSADVDETGRLNATLHLESIGDNFFAIDVIQNGRRAVKDNFTVVREQKQAALTPDTDYLRVYENAFECRGMTEPGATLTGTIEGKTFSGQVAEDGTYSLACELNTVGFYPLTIKATNAERSDTEATVMVEMLPEPNDFMNHAQSLSVGKIKSSLGSLGDKGIKTTGSVEGLTSKAYKQTFQIVSGKDTINCYYYGTVRLTQGSSYTFFGTADTAADSFYVMFVV